MAVKMLSAAVFATLLTVAGAEGQSLAQIGGPANPPPRSFKGQQFVDSRGCLFLRAGSGARVNWVVRVDRNHKPICGMPPSGGGAAQAALAADMAPDPQAGGQGAATAMIAAPVVVAPMMAANAPLADQTATNQTPTTQTARAPQGGFRLGQLFGLGARPVQPRPDPAPTVFSPAATQTGQIQPQSQVQPQAPSQTAALPYQGAGVATSVGGVQCYGDAPVLERVNVAGGTALVCTRGDGSVNGWRPPRAANAQQAQIAAQTAPLVTAPVTAVQVMAPVQYAPVQTAALPYAPVQMAAVQITLPVAPSRQAVARSHALPKPPKGWAYAWKDDRLNPLRGVGTAEGQAQQDQIWTRTVPMILVTDVPHKRPVAQVSGLRTTVSTMSTDEQQRAMPAAQQVSVVPAIASAATGTLLVQVGSFGDPANAQSTASRLASLGLAVSTTTVTRKGKTLQIVYAGPFASAAQAQAGLATLHGAGFGDAFLR